MGPIATVSDTTDFKINGALLQVNSNTLSGSYPITITATPSVVGDTYVSAYGASPGQTFTITAGTTSGLTVPPAISGLGYTLRFFDDFTTNTIEPNQVTALETGKNWYPTAGSSNTATNYVLNTTQLASQVSNGNTSGESNNASPSGGIVDSIWQLCHAAAQATFRG